jgi:3-isopropylmalate dehydrogenase
LEVSDTKNDSDPIYEAVEAAALIERAMESVIHEGKILTGDLGGTASTSKMGDAVAARI